MLGLGTTGLSVVRFLLDREAALVRVHDTADQPRGLTRLHSFSAASGAQAKVDWRPGPLGTELFESIDLVVLSPGVSRLQPVIAHAHASGVEIVGDIEMFAAALPKNPRPWVLAITGTNGKTTVTALTGALLRSAGIDVEVAGNIGPAALDALLDRERSGRAPQAWVLELSSYQLELTAGLAADSAAMLNLSEDHLDRYPNLAAYACAKRRIFIGARHQVLNRDDPTSLAMREQGTTLSTFGLQPPDTATSYGLIECAGAAWLARGEQPILPCSRLHLAGRHNAANALAALALIDSLPVDRSGLATALAGFRGLPHRVELVAERDGVRFYDDSKGTNVGATIAAIEGLAPDLAATGARLVLIAGGDGKGQSFAPLSGPVGRHVRQVVLIGRDAARLQQALQGTTRISHADSMQQAVAQARAAAVSGDVVLLSPACASLDMFRDYAHRAEVFVAAVKETCHV